MIKSKGSGDTFSPDQSISDRRSLAMRSNTELLEAINEMMARPAEEIDMDFVEECLDILQDRAPVMEDYDPQAALDRLHEEHPLLFEIEEPPSAKAAPAPKRRRTARWARYGGAFVAAMLCLVVTAHAFGYNPVHALFQWVNDTIRVYSNPSGLMELPFDDPSEYHSLEEALVANGMEDADRITWIPKDYALSYIQVSTHNKMLQVSAVYEADRGELAVRVLSMKTGNWIGRAESDPNETEYRHNDTVFYISSNIDIMKAGWKDENCSYEISGQVSEEEIKKMIDSITGGV